MRDVYRVLWGFQYYIRICVCPCISKGSVCFGPLRRGMPMSSAAPTATGTHLARSPKP